MQQTQSPKAKVSGAGKVLRPDGTVKTDHVLNVPAPQPTGEKK